MMLQVAAQAVATMPSLLLFPVIPLLMQTALVFYWIFVAAYLYSSGKHRWLHMVPKPLISLSNCSESKFSKSVFTMK